MLSQTKKSEMQVIAGCLRGLGGYLTNFEQETSGGMLAVCVQCHCNVHARMHEVAKCSKAILCVHVSRYFLLPFVSLCLQNLLMLKKFFALQECLSTLR